jgi:hypothetical protein
MWSKLSCRSGRIVTREEPPNLRLKLSGLFLMESAVGSPGGPPGVWPVPCANGHAARSLSAIR